MVVAGDKQRFTLYKLSDVHIHIYSRKWCTDKVLPPLKEALHVTTHYVAGETIEGGVHWTMGSYDLPSSSDLWFIAQ